MADGGEESGISQQIQAVRLLAVHGLTKNTTHFHLIQKQADQHIKQDRWLYQFCLSLVKTSALVVAIWCSLWL